MYKALKSFSGKITMNKGQVKKITDKEVIKDLLRAGYIEELEPTKKEEPKLTKKKNSIGRSSVIVIKRKSA